MGKIWLDVLARKMEEEAMSQGMWAAPRSWEGQETVSSSMSMGNTALPTQLIVP